MAKEICHNCIDSNADGGKLYCTVSSLLSPVTTVTLIVVVLSSVVVVVKWDDGNILRSVA